MKMSLHVKQLFDRAYLLTYSKRLLWTLASKNNKLQTTRNVTKSKSELIPALSSRHERIQLGSNCGLSCSNNFTNNYNQERLFSFKACIHYVHVHGLKCASCLGRRRNMNKIWRHDGAHSNHCRYYSSMKDDMVNPIQRLQRFVTVPLLPPENHLFNPSTKEMETAETFWVQGTRNIKFLKSAKFQDQLPDDNLPEVTFIGRSNVGKSSLIQAMFIKSDVVVRISKTPGHTKQLNFFEVKDGFRLVDVPGYGFKMPEDYTEVVETFLRNRPNLSRTFVLLDGSVGVNEADIIGINMIEEFQLPYVFVITKIDKVPPAVLIKNLLVIQKVMKDARYCFPQPFLVSSKTFEGLKQLQTFITYLTGNVAIKGL